MAAKLCKEQQRSFGNNVKYSDFIDGKYLLRNKRLKGLCMGIRGISVYLSRQTDRQTVFECDAVMHHILLAVTNG